MKITEILDLLEDIANNTCIDILAFRHTHRLNLISTIIRNRLENEQNRNCVDHGDSTT